MTEYKDEVTKQKELLAEEQLDKDVEFVEVTFKDGKWQREMTGYKSGRRVIKYNDKRRKEETEWR